MVTFKRFQPSCLTSKMRQPTERPESPTIYLFALILLAAGVYHFVNPDFYNPIMPEWFPKKLANAAGGIAELIIGVMLLVPKTKPIGIWLALALMVAFLPIHVLDLLKTKPAIGPHWVAAIRLVIQFALIGWLYWRATATDI